MYVINFNVTFIYFKRHMEKSKSSTFLCRKFSGFRLDLGSPYYTD